MSRKFDYPVEELRHMGKFFDHWNETWNSKWTMDELIAIYRFAMSDEGDHIDEDPTTWDRAILRKAGIRLRRLTELGYTTRGV